MTIAPIDVTAPVDAEVQVQIVDCDIHPYPGRDDRHVLVENTPEPFRTEFYGDGTKVVRHGNSMVWDPPEYHETKSMRKNTLPPNGGFAASDSLFAARQLFYEVGVDIGILTPLYLSAITPEADLAKCMGINSWLDKAWLSPERDPNERFRGSITVTWANPEGSALEIERWAGHPKMVQAAASPEIRLGMGDPRHDPIFEAATRHGLPISCHIGRGPDERLPLPPYGPGSWYLDTFSSLMPLNICAHLTSLVFDGAFERHPDLKIVFVETGWAFVMPMMWRLDAYWKALRHNLPHVKRPPSQYILEHVKFTTQPVEDPQLGEMVQYIDWLQGDRLLMFSTDYPHWSGDEPGWVVQRIPKHMRDRIMHQNAQELYGLPSTVPALIPLND
jgi:predicted TIM-barrel fold metal-dependent hydrolase